MGLADELRSLQELHEKGKLTDREYADAKAATLKHHQESPTASRRLGRFFGFRAIPLLIILLGLLALVWYNVGTRNTTKAIATAIHAPITVIDEVENIPASSMKGLAINLPYGGTVAINLEVVQGNPIDVFLSTPDQLETIKKQDWNNVKVYSDFNATKTKTYRRTGQLVQGSYYLVMRDTSLGILSSSASDISVKVQLNP
jgi:hypothetical protein